MSKRSKLLVVVGGVVATLLLFTVAGLALRGSFMGMERLGSGLMSTKDSSGQIAPDIAFEDTAVRSGAGTPSYGEQYVIATANLSVYVDDVSGAADKTRSIATDLGGRISDFNLNTGGFYPVEPYAKDSASVSDEFVSGSITVRVPSEKLDVAIERIGALGKVESSSESEYDVTLQRVDLAARLDNLKASESRMRELLAQATNVDETVRVEAELSRLRGEIDSLQGQLDYLDDSIEMSTLSVYLQKTPSASQGWVGFDLGELAMRGIASAFDLIGTIIVGAIAVSPLAAIGAVIWIVVRTVRRRKHAE